MELFEHIKSYLKEKKADYLYVNHTNEFFSEYVDVSKSSRYILTQFSGSTGDAIVSNDKIYLFVDSRYWEQAELEVDTNIVEVIKLGKDLTFDNAITKLLKPKAKILFYQNKTSFLLYERFLKYGFCVDIIENDIVENYAKVVHKNLNTNFTKIPNAICGQNSDTKIKKLQNKLKDNEILVVSSLEDVSYLLNMYSSNFEYSSSIFGKLVIQKNDYKFFVEENEFEKYIKKLSDKKSFAFLLDKANLSIKYKKYFAKYEQAKFLSTLRSIKYKKEIEHLKTCFERTDKVLNSVFEVFKKEEFTEKSLFDFVNKKFVEFGAYTNSFKTILASGKNSSIVHFSHPTDRKINKGEFVLLDCGGMYEGGYATDITRTFLKGEPSQEQKTVYTTVLKAFLNSYNADLKKYKTCYDIDTIARKIIADAKLEGYTFGHGLGHSVGRCVHDGLPVLSPSAVSKMKIKKNMVFTVEPGLYKPNCGGVRLENTVFADKVNGKLVLKSFSKAPFQKSLIDFSMLSNKEKKYLDEWELV